MLHSKRIAPAASNGILPTAHSSVGRAAAF